jgi:hypothetical protein
MASSVVVDGCAAEEEQSGAQGGEQLAALGEPRKAVVEEGDLATAPSDFDDVDLEGDGMAMAGAGVECTAAEAQFLSKFNLTTAAAAGAAGAKPQEKT